MVQQPSPHNQRINKNIAISHGYCTPYKSTTLKVADALSTPLAPTTLITPVLEDEVGFTLPPIYRRHKASCFPLGTNSGGRFGEHKNLLALANSSVQTCHIITA